jgi:DegV family protein with EDD domain
MQIVTDRACDITDDQLSGLDIHFAPMRLTLDGKSYSSGEDLSSEEFYDLLEKTDEMPITSQATAGDFAALYRRLAEKDKDILSIHISSGLSGTLNAAMVGAEMVPEANVTFWDSLTLSAPQAWQVEAAAQAIKEGMSIPQISNILKKVREKTEGVFTVETLKYLINGGRISHLQGLVGSLLQLKPVIAVSKDEGKYYTLAKERTTKRALLKIAESLMHFYPEGSHLRVQMLHGKNYEAVQQLKEMAEEFFQCHWVPTVHVGPILGAHTGGSLVGLCAAPIEVFDEVNIK